MKLHVLAVLRNKACVLLGAHPFALTQVTPNSVARPTHTHTPVGDRTLHGCTASDTRRNVTHSHCAVLMPPPRSVTWVTHSHHARSVPLMIVLSTNSTFPSVQRILLSCKLGRRL